MQKLNKQEAIVYDLIVAASPKTITQLEISRLAPQLGSHEKHEGYISQQSTLRKIRSIVRDLVMKHGLYIGAGRAGYYIVKTPEQIKEYMDRFENQAKASAKSYLQRYNVMSKNFGIKSRYFDSQSKLLFE